MRAVVVLLVVAGFAAGYGLGSLSQRSEGGAGGRMKRARDSTAAPKPVQRAMPTVGAAPVDGAFTADLPKGDGIITGSVLDDAGDPVAGVLVVGQPVRSWRPQKISKAPAGPDERDIDELVREWAGAVLWRRRGSTRATTDEDGRYVLTGLGDVGYRVTAYKKGFLLRRRNRRQGNEVRAPAEVHFIAGAVVRVPIEVVMADGSQPEFAQIWIMQDMPDGGRSGTSETWTSDAPWIEVPPGSYGLYASTWGKQPMRPKETRTIVSADTPTDPVKLTIVINPSLRVSVVPPAGFGLIPGRPRIVRIHGDRVPTKAELLESNSLTAWDDGDGVYLFRDLDPGRYLIGVSVSRGAPIGVSKVVEVRSGTVNAALQFPAPDPAAYFVLRPVGPDGKTPTTLSWAVHMRSGTGRSTRGVGQALRRDDGVLFLAVPAEHLDTKAKHAVTAQSAEWGSVRAEVHLNSVEIVPIVFREPGYVDAAITGYAGSGREGRLTLQLMATNDSQRRAWSSQNMKPDEKGVLRLGPVQPGNYELQLMLEVSGHSTLRIFQDVIAVRSGRQKASVTIPSLHELTVTWTGKGTPQLSLRPIEKSMRYVSIAATVGADGKAVFRDLPAGEYAVRVPGVRRGPPQTVSIPGTTELSLP